MILSPIIPRSFKVRPRFATPLIKAMADKGYNEDNIDEFLKRERDINAYLMNLPQIAEILKELPDYSDYNHGKANNYSLQNAKRKIEHMTDGQLVEGVSIERGGPKDASGQYTPMLDQLAEFVSGRRFDLRSAASPTEKGASLGAPFSVGDLVKVRTCRLGAFENLLLQISSQKKYKSP